MPPKEKANELVNKYLSLSYAIIAVDEIIVAENKEFLINTRQIEYWQKVKAELQKLKK